MNLFIETENGATKNHPAFEENLIQAFGSIPAQWESFIRVERPAPAMYQTMDSQEPVYAKVDGVWTDVWSLKDMTAEEITAKQQVAKDAWSVLPNRDNFTAWIFDEATCTYQPPIPRPTEGDYFWQGTTSSWQVRPERPIDDQNYKFNFNTGTWELLDTPSTITTPIT